MRKVTQQLISMMEEGALNPYTVATTCLGYMSEAEVADMAETNDLLFLLPETEEEEIPDDTCVQDEQAWYDAQDQ